MKVERIDLYDFKVLLTEQEFKDICAVSDYDNTPFVDVLRSVFECGFDVLRNGNPFKE